MSRTGQNALMLGLVLGSVLVGAHDAVFYWRDVDPDTTIASFWSVAFVVLLVLWLERDSRGRSEVQRPFDFDFLVFLFWLPYLPYYLWRTRRWAGLVLLVGLVGLFFLSPLLMLAIQFAR